MGKACAVHGIWVGGGEGGDCRIENCPGMWRVAQRVIGYDGWAVVSLCSGFRVLGCGFWVLGSGPELWCHWLYYYEQVWVAGIGESGPMRSGADLAQGFLPITGLTLCFRLAWNGGKTKLYVRCVLLPIASYLMAIVTRGELGYRNWVLVASDIQ